MDNGPQNTVHLDGTNTSAWKNSQITLDQRCEIEARVRHEKLKAKNRIAARRSYRRRKKLVSRLLEDSLRLQKENEKLRQENTNLQRELFETKQTKLLLPSLIKGTGPCSFGSVYRVNPVANPIGILLKPRQSGDSGHEAASASSFVSTHLDASLMSIPSSYNHSVGSILLKLRLPPHAPQVD